MEKLPFELQLKILSYTYQPQSSSLCFDIKSYVETKRQLLFLYETCDFKNSDLLSWMINDLIVYWNRFQPALYYGFHKDFIGLVRRHERFCQSGANAYIYLLRNFKKNQREDVDISREINFIWGLMLHEERQDFFDLFFVC